MMTVDTIKRLAQRCPSFPCAVSANLAISETFRKIKIIAAQGMSVFTMGLFGIFGSRANPAKYIYSTSHSL